MCCELGRSGFQVSFGNSQDISIQYDAKNQPETGGGKSHWQSEIVSFLFFYLLVGKCCFAAKIYSDRGRLLSASGVRLVPKREIMRCNRAGAEVAHRHDGMINGQHFLCKHFIPHSLSQPNMNSNDCLIKKFRIELSQAWRLKVEVF